METRAIVDVRVLQSQNRLPQCFRLLQKVLKVLRLLQWCHCDARHTSGNTTVFVSLESHNLHRDTDEHTVFVLEVY